MFFFYYSVREKRTKQVKMIMTNPDHKQARTLYRDIIDLPHHQSQTREHMPLRDRAAQFAPFAALTGYHDMVKEEARLTEDRVILSETELDMLSQKLSLICDMVEGGDHPLVAVTYFLPDEKKSGGRYETVTGPVKKVDAAARTVVLLRTGHPENPTASPLEIQLDTIIDLTTDFK